jgi:ubiquinone/menaquinone biosynthesis C-methylase UbiE
MTRLASRRLRKLNPSPSIVQAEAQALPFPAGYFNTLITTFPTEFMMDPSTIAQVSRTLRPKGRVIVIPVAEIHGRSLVDRAAAWLFRVTGQSGELPDSWYAPYVQAGFDIAREDIDIGRSSVTRITATKNSAEIAP